MSVFGSILSSIFGHGQAQAQTPTQAQPAPAQTQATTAQATQPRTGDINLGANIPGVGAVTTNPQPVNVDQVLKHLDEQQPGKSNYKESIVDLLKLVGVDSSLENRKALAHELGYTGSTDDSAAMNVWLHKATMDKLQQNGGVIPANFKD